MKPVYLDHAATSPMTATAVHVFNSSALVDFGNPSSLHQLGKSARQAIEQSRRILAQSLNCSPSEIIFTSGGTESNNLAIKGVARAFQQTGEKNVILCSAIEHPSVLESCASLADQGVTVHHIPVNHSGIVNLTILSQLLSQKPILVSVMHVNNETGIVQPIAKIVKICREKGVLLHVDAVQSFLRLDINLQSVPIDLLSISAHKIGGPKGVGALFVREGTHLSPVIHGGGQEFGLRSGTENVSGILTFATAVTAALSDKERIAHLRDLKSYLTTLLSSVPRWQQTPSDSPHIIHGIIKDAEGRAIVDQLSEKGVFVSTGSACSSVKLEPSHILTAMGFSTKDALAGIRFSLGFQTTKEEIDRAVAMLKAVL